MMSKVKIIIHFHNGFSFRPAPPPLPPCPHPPLPQHEDFLYTTLVVEAGCSLLLTLSSPHPSCSPCSPLIPPCLPAA